MHGRLRARDRKKSLIENEQNAGESARVIAAAVAALGPGPLTESAVARHLRPLFTRTLASPHTYLANHSLGRPLDAVEADLREGLFLWQHALSDAWGPWLEEEANYRTQLAALLGADRNPPTDGPSPVVPRVSAGAALRTVLNMLPAGARVLSTGGEFTSVAMLLAQYASLGRIQLTLVSPTVGPHGERFETEALADALHTQDRGKPVSHHRGKAISLVVVSHVFFATGQLLPRLNELAHVCHHAGARLVVDSYHSLGALPVDVAAMQCDYLIGGCYKYLRGGPGAAFLYLSPQVLAAGLRPLDTGWFALEAEWQNDAGPRLRQGADALHEGTPAVLTYYQARSGLAFTAAVGVERLRAYSLQQLRALQMLLEEQGIASGGGDALHGAFLTVAARDAEGVASRLAEEGVIVNARRGLVRLCPDCLTTAEELKAAARALGRAKPLIDR